MGSYQTRYEFEFEDRVVRLNDLDIRKLVQMAEAAPNSTYAMTMGEMTNQNLIEQGLLTEGYAVGNFYKLSTEGRRFVDGPLRRHIAIYALGG